jgi:CMP-N,N'-diacetyllegionaminic acid synthase
MDILAIIPARGGSKGIPRKNIKLLKGKPLIQYALDQAKRLGLFKNIVVSTEDDEIAGVCSKLGHPLTYKRPDSLSLDSTPTLPVILHVLEEEKKLGNTYDAVCLLQTTAPLRSDTLVLKAIEKLRQGKNLDAVVSMKEVPSHFHPNWVFKQVSEEHIRPYEEEVITQRQLLKPVYYRDGSVYLTTVNCLINKASLFGEKTGMVINDDLSINLDTMQDWNDAEKMLGDICVD